MRKFLLVILFAGLPACAAAQPPVYDGCQEPEGSNMRESCLLSRDMRVLDRALETALARQRRQTHRVRLLAAAQTTWLAHRTASCNVEQDVLGGGYYINITRCAHRMLTERVEYVQHLATVARQQRYWPGADVLSGAVQPRPPECQVPHGTHLPDSCGRLAPLEMLERELDAAMNTFIRRNDTAPSLAGMQPAWRDFREANCALERALDNGVHATEPDFCMRRMTAERLHYLQTAF
jgi:uncharacterized protein YecT (DUF1311 family)